MGKASVQPSERSSVPHQTTTSGEEYAVASKVVPRQQQQQPPVQEYAMVDKSKKASASQGVSYVQNYIHTYISPAIFVIAFWKTNLSNTFYTFVRTVQSNYNFTLPRVITLVNVCYTQRTPVCFCVACQVRKTRTE